MRKHILLTICLSIALLVNIARAQNDEIKGTNLEAYAGTWQCISQTDTFILVLKIGTAQFSYGIEECLLGAYFYSKGGKVLANYLGLTDSLSQNNRVCYATNAYKGQYAYMVDPYIVTASFFSQSKESTPYMRGIFELNMDDSNQMAWKLDSPDPDYTTVAPTNGYTLPAIMQLIKVKEKR